jgi:CRP-like cAMP-binding protein
LLALKDDGTGAVRSSLEPVDGIPLLNEVALPQERDDMERRREWLDLGDALRKLEPFSSLSSAEAAVLGTFFDRIEFQPNELIVRQGDVADALYLIESGEAEISVLKADGRRVSAASVGPGCFFGEIALITKSERTADVIAKTPMRLLKLSKEAYNDYLRHLADVHNKFAHMALDKAQEQLRTLKSS